MDKIPEDLNAPQKEAVLHTEGPLIIFAGAGTGKTRVITYRIAHLLSKNISPLDILAVTFTNKAAEEMRKRVDYLVPGSGRSVWISTFHSFCARFLRTEAVNIKLNPDFLIYDDTDQKNIIKNCIAELLLDDKKYKPARFINIISRAKDEMLDAQSYKIHAIASNDEFRIIAGNVYELYQKKLEQAGALDFGDLLLVTVNTLRDNQMIREKYQQRFKYVMIDEYQDTNHAQYLFAKYLSAKHKNICVVGDDDQSIYSWRGADIRNILEFEKDYPDCKMIKLEENYRSTQNILDSAWRVIKNNEKRVEKKVWTTKDKGEEIRLLETRTGLEEAQTIVDEIDSLNRQEHIKYSDFAVFYRTNAQSRVLEDAMRRTGIPYVIIGSVRFYDRQEIKNIMAYLRLIHNPSDSVGLERIINVPKRGIGKTSFEKLERYAIENNITLWQALESINSIDITPSARKAFLSFKGLLLELSRDKNNKTVKEIVMSVLSKSGYIQELEQEDTPESKSRIENIHELVSAIDEFENRSPDKSLAGYLTQVSLVNDTDDLSEDKERVVLMTLHLAKGLEFKTVFITGLEEGLFPIGESAFDQEDLEEERRLMYVGITRAREKLYLSWAQERTVFGKTNWNLPSRFIVEAKGKDALVRFNSSVESDYQEHEVVIKRVHKEENSPFPIECRVKHEKFGEGKVIDKSGSGEDLKVVVLFDTGQWKKLMVKYANLERLN